MPKKSGRPASARSYSNVAGTPGAGPPGAGGASAAASAAEPRFVHPHAFINMGAGIIMCSKCGRTPADVQAATFNQKLCLAPNATGADALTPGAPGASATVDSVVASAAVASAGARANVRVDGRQQGRANAAPVAAAQASRVAIPGAAVAAPPAPAALPRITYDDTSKVCEFLCR